MLMIPPQPLQNISGTRYAELSDLFRQQVLIFEKNIRDYEKNHIRISHSVVFDNILLGKQPFEQTSEQVCRFEVRNVHSFQYADIH